MMTLDRGTEQHQALRKRRSMRMDFQGVEKNEEEAKNTWLEKRKEENDKNQTHAIKHQKRPTAHQNGDQNEQEKKKKKKITTKITI